MHSCLQGVWLIKKTFLDQEVDFLKDNSRRQIVLLFHSLSWAPSQPPAQILTSLDSSKSVIASLNPPKSHLILTPTLLSGIIKSWKSNIHHVGNILGKKIRAHLTFFNFKMIFKLGVRSLLCICCTDCAQPFAISGSLKALLWTEPSSSGSLWRPTPRQNTVTFDGAEIFLPSTRSKEEFLMK